MTNVVILIGRICADPENRVTASGAQVARFTLAVDRGRKDANGNKQTDFIRCSAWNKTAEFVVNFIHKGRLLAIEGQLHINSVTQADGTRRDYTEVTCRSVQPLEYDKPDQNEPHQPEAVDDSDDLPFDN